MKSPFLWRLRAPHLLALLMGLCMSFAPMAHAVDTSFTPFAGLVRTHRQGPETNPADRLFPGPTIDVGDHDDNAGHGTVQGFVGFDLTALPAGQIANARLTLREASAAQGGHITGEPFRDGNHDSEPDRGDIFVERALNTGGPGVGFFNLNLGAPNTNIRLIKSPTQAGIWSADVSSLVQAAKAAGDSFVVLRLRFRDLRDNDNQIDLASFEPLSLLVTTNNVTPQFQGFLDPDRTTVRRGQFITYTLRFKPVGAAATNVRVAVTLGQHMLFPPFGIPGFFGTGNTLVLNVGDVAENSERTVRFQLQVKADAPFGAVLRPFVIVSANNIPALSGTPQTGVTVIAPRLVATLTPRVTSIVPGNSLFYDLVVRADGALIENAAVEILQSRASTVPPTGPGTIDPSGSDREGLIVLGLGNIRYNFGSLAIGQEVRRAIRVVVPADATSGSQLRPRFLVFGNATNSVGGTPVGGDLSNTVPVVEVEVTTQLVIALTAPKFVEQGHVITYNIVVGNKGTLPAQNVQAVGDIPPGTTLVAGSARFLQRQGTVNVDNTNRDVVFSLSQPLPPGTSANQNDPVAAIMEYKVRVSDKYRGTFGSSRGNIAGAFADNADSEPEARVRTGIGAGTDFGLALQDFVSGIGGAIGNFFKGIGDFFNGFFGGGAAKPGAAPDSNLPPEVQRLADLNGISLGVGGADVVAVGGANIIALGGANIIANGGGNVIAIGGANVIRNNRGGSVINGNGSTVVAVGGANIVAVGGGNIIANGGNNIIAVGGANIIAVGGANLTPVPAAQLVGLNGSGVIPPPAPGTGVIALGGANVLSGNNIIANGGNNIVAVGGGNLTQQQRATVIALGGANIIANGGNN